MGLAGNEFQWWCTCFLTAKVLYLYKGEDFTPTPSFQVIYRKSVANQWSALQEWTSLCKSPILRIRTEKASVFSTWCWKPLCISVCLCNWKLHCNCKYTHLFTCHFGKRSILSGAFIVVQCSVEFKRSPLFNPWIQIIGTLNQFIGLFQLSIERMILLRDL